jgi:glucose/arabinose dehydrogenase
LLIGVALPLWLASVAAAAAGLDERPGQRYEIRAEDMPPPYATKSVGNAPEAVALPAKPPFQVPEGFAVNAFAEGLDSARWMAVAPNGDVFLAEQGANKVTLLRDRDGDGWADLVTTYADGFDLPHGLAFQDGWLYVADVRGVWRLPWHPGADKAAKAPTPVTKAGAIGSGEGHSSRNVIFSRDGRRFYVAIGSQDNLAEEKPPRASVQSFAADGSDQRTYAYGLRNPVGIALYPGTNDLYVVVNERDGLGDGLVPDYLTRLAPGGFYGWPYAYIGAHPQPNFPKRPDMVAKALVPDLLFAPHSAPLGLLFYEGAQFPPDYRGDAFVALHGSWNSSVPIGYKIVRVPFANGRPVGYYENFLTGFWSAGSKTAQVWGRPVGLAVAADGSLLIADDLANAIWRVSYRKK